MNETYKRYFVSSLVTFLTGFAMVLVADAKLDTVTLDSVKDGSFMGVIFLAFRGGIKAVLEGFIAHQATKE